MCDNMSITPCESEQLFALSLKIQNKKKKISPNTSQDTKSAG